MLNRAALTAMEMASYRLPSHCRSCGNESERDFNPNTFCFNIPVISHCMRCRFKHCKTRLEAATHQHVHVEDPAVFSWTDAEALQVHAVLVVEDLVESVAQLHPQLLASSALELGGCIGWTRCVSELRKRYIKKTVMSWDVYLSEALHLFSF